jgi:hypothetical protein
MKTTTWRKNACIIAAMAILTGNLIGISVLATEESDPVTIGVSDDPPPGVLKGYLPVTVRVKTGEHFEYFGWVGAPFARLVSEYSEVRCCMKTLRSMDGCKDLKICDAES